MNSNIVYRRRSVRRVLRLVPGLGNIGLFLSFAAVSFLPHTALGLGFRIPNQDAEAIARGNAFVATANNPSAIYYNPAGITQLPGHQVRLGFHNLSANSTYEAPSGVEAETEYQIHPIPQFYYTYSSEKLPVSIGLGVYSPHGLGLEWPEESGFRTIAQKGELIYMSANPVVAWQVHPTFSIAAGLTLNYSEVMLRQGVFVRSDQLALAAPDYFHFRGDNFAWGFNVGLRWQPVPQWAFGATYRSATTVNYKGSTSFSPSPPYPPEEDSSARVDFPQIITAGISFRPTTNWNIEANVDWTDWESLNTVTIHRGSTDIPVPFNWQSSWLYEVGVTRYLSQGYWIGAGYFFSQNSTREESFNPIVPDTDLHVGSLGFGFKGRHWQWAISGQIITGPARNVSGSQSTSVATPPESADGKYHWFNQAVNVAVGYHF